MHPTIYVPQFAEKGGSFWNGSQQGGTSVPPIRLSIIDRTHTGYDVRSTNWPELFDDAATYNGVTVNSDFLTYTLPEIIKVTADWLDEDVLGVHCESTTLELSSRLFELQQRIIQSLMCVALPFKHHRKIFVSYVKITENSTNYAILVLPNE